MPMQMTATYHVATDTIYYLGGKRYDPIVAYTDVVIPLSWCLTFHMSSLKWENITLTGPKIPTPRVLHSATLCKRKRVMPSEHWTDILCMYSNRYKGHNTSVRRIAS